MRTTVRVLSASLAAVGLLGIGSTPALAAKTHKKSRGDSTVTAAAEGGYGGNGGNGGLGLNVCPAIGLLAKAEAQCMGGNGGSANGGDAEATAEDDSHDTTKTKKKRRSRR